MEPVSIILTTVGWLASPIFKKISDEAWQQFTKRVGLKAEIDDLKKELKNFRVPVETADTAKYLKEFKELISEAKDLLDELDYFRLQDEVKQKNKAEQGNKFSKLILPSPSDVPNSSTKKPFKELKFDKKGMCKRMKDLIEKLKLTCEPLNSTIQQQLLSSIVEKIQNVKTPFAKRPETTSYPPEEKIYGRDSEIEKIENLINHGEQDPQKLRVISLVGHGGVGKTTLAQQVFNGGNHPTIKFDQKIWICVSTNLDEMGITRQMLKYCAPNNVMYDYDSSEEFLKRELEKYLKEKTFLLVLDDIWEMSETQWKSLLDPLKKVVANNTAKNTGSMVIVTTRKQTIATMVSTTGPIYLSKLDDHTLWSFFVKCAFGDDRYNVPIAFENIGRKIVERLSGNPLAAKTVGKMLKDQNDLKKWVEVLEYEEWKFLKEEDAIMPILRLSYEKLPIQLKLCFSYCSLFPKDYYFKDEDLVYMWMAQDFINKNDEIVNNSHPRKDKSMEDVGFEYLNLLVEGAFFQKVVTDWDKGEYVVMHDLMHDLAQVVSSKEILAINHEPSLYPHSLRHLSFLQEVKYTNENFIKFRNISSLVIFQNAKGLKDTFNWQEATKFPLRLLILPCMSSISYNYIHLRYLQLRYHWEDEETTFPVQICSLYHLQVLELRDPNGYVKELPKEFNKLVNLRHFIANEVLHCKIAEVGRLKYLQELKRFVVHEEKGFELGQLSELKELRGSLKICSLQNVKCREEAESIRLSEKEIEELELQWDKETEDKPRLNRGDKGKWRTWLNGKGKECRTTITSSEEILDALQPTNHLRRLSIFNYGGCKSPSWLTNHSIEYLESIHLVNCEALEELPNFGQLTCLKELWLNGLPRVKALGPQFHGCSLHEGFPSLKMIRVSDMDELETWDWGERYNVFPLLETLRVSSCPNLREFTFLQLVPVHGESTKWFPKLNHLTIRACPELQQAIPPEIISFISTRGIIKAKIGGEVGHFIYSRNNDDFFFLEKKNNDDLKMVNLKEPEILALITLSLKNIRSMEFYNCPKLPSLSWKCICQINSLKRLQFYMCNELCFSTEEKDTGRTSYSHESLQELKIDECRVTGEELSYLLAHFPAIRILTIRKCHDIGFVSLPSIIDETNRDYSEAEVKVDKDQQRSPDSLMCLEELHINDCPNMAFVNKGGLSGLTALKEVGISGSDKLLYSLNQKEGSNYVHTLSVEQSNYVHTLKLHSFVALRKLKLWRCKGLASVEGTNSPASLEVVILDCPQLAKTHSQIEPKFLMAVEKLSIDNMEFLSIHANSFSMSLHSLTIEDSSWNEWTEEQEYVVIKHLTALEELTLSYCTELRSLPSTLHLHPSLKELTIDGCEEIKSLPQRGFPKTLQKLLLLDCSEELKSQCSQLEDFECSKETDKWIFEYDVFSKRDPSAN